MKVKLQVQQNNHAPKLTYHCIDDAHLVVGSKLFVLSEGVAWPNAVKESNGLISSVTEDAGGTVWELLCLYAGSYPSAEECTEHVVSPEVIDTTGMEIITISGQTQADIDSATKASEILALKSQLSALDSEVSRSAENMYKQGIYTSISDREKAAIAQKENLRAQIAALN